MHRFLFALLFSLLPICLFAGNTRNVSGAQSAALGFSSVSFVNPWSAINNQAGLGFTEDIQLSAYAENRFLLTELSLFSLAAAVPTKSGTFGLGLSYFGDEFLSETFLRLGYGRKLSEQLSIGIELDYFSLDAGLYGSKGAATFGIGVLYKVNAKLQVGAHFFNPLNITLTNQENDDIINNALRVGATYRPSKKVFVNFEAEKNIDDPLVAKIGVDYSLKEAVALRIGYASEPDLLTVGVGFLIQQIRIDLAGSFHWELGASPHVSLSYVIPRSK